VTGYTYRDGLPARRPQTVTHRTGDLLITSPTP